MKPEDILNAVGEVDEKFVKSAHRKDRMKAFFASAMTCIFCIWLLSMTMEPDYVLARFHTDGTANTGYVNPMHLNDDHWTSVHQTSYENGQEVGYTTFSRSLFNKYSILQKTPDGSKIKLVGEIRGEYHRNEYHNQIRAENLYTSSFVTKDLIDRIDSLVIHSETTFPGEPQLLNMVQFEYYSNQFLVMQRKVTDTELIGYRVLDYENHRISKTTDYDSSDRLISYTEYIYDDNFCTSSSYSADGILIDSEITEYDWLNRIQSREVYDGSDSLISREIYHYRVWELFGSIEGLLSLTVIIFFSMAIGIGVYDDRIRLPAKKQ